MLIQPTSETSGVFIDKLRVEAVVPHGDVNYAVVFVSGAVVEVGPDVGHLLLAELAAK